MAQLDEETRPELELRLAPDAPVIIGRGSQPEYLDPSLWAIDFVPGTGQSVLNSAGHDRDLRVSRAHFMLRESGGGLLLVNGVPSPGGGIRPPLNGTRMLSPEDRELLAGEEYLIPTGASVRLQLPNKAVLELSAG